MKELRTEKLSLQFSKAELKLLDDLKQKMQVVNIHRISRGDVIAECLKFATDSMPLK